MGFIKPIFRTGPGPALKALLLVVIAVTFLFAEHYSTTVKRWRNDMTIVVYPLQWLVDAPIQLVHWLGTSVLQERKLIAENAELRAHEFMLQSQLDQLLSLKHENAQLKELLKSSSHIEGRVKVAQLMAVSITPALHQVVLDKGDRQGVYNGQPVLDAYGVVGQVINTTPYTSRVLLLTDTRAAVPVRDARNGVRAVAIGLGLPDQLSVINVPDTVDIQQGDLFVTSGMGMRYPIGYPVGVVDKVAHEPGQRFTVIRIRPAAHLDQTQQVLLAWPSHRALAKQVQQELVQ